MQVAESVVVKFLGMVIPMPIVLAKSRFEQDIMDQCWELSAGTSEGNLDDLSCELTILAIDGSKQVLFVATLQGHKRNRFMGSARNP